MQTAIVFDIQKFSIHDGPGIRTNVFIKGCPLRCQWCHNPESWNPKPEILFDPEKCTACRECAPLCPKGLHSFDGPTHSYNRQNCISCGACTDHCYTGALELCGTPRTPQECLKEVMKDKPFYDNSGGGMTLSGGEPMMHFDFTLELLKLAKQEGLHTCIETCGFAPWEHYEQILPLIDIFLYDIKSINPERHRQFTGQDNALILENVRKLDDAGATIQLRCPIIPGLNDRPEDLKAIAELANSMKHVTSIDVEPYHPLGVSKAKRLGIPDGFAAPFAPTELAMEWVETIQKETTVPVKKQ